MRSLFEFSIALKYLIPRRKQLSVALISLLSVTVISLVVWLVLVFLSVTEGMERNWLQKLTVLNAPLRITPTPHYYSSYYYQVDASCSRSGYALKTVGEKALSPISDPYNPDEDGQLPAHLPEPDVNTDGSLKDPVKGLFTLLSDLKETKKDLAYQDFEISGALMRLQLLRPSNDIHTTDNQGYLTQVSYLASFPSQCPGLSSLVLPPTEKDLNHLIYLANYSTDLSRQDAPALAQKAKRHTALERVEHLLKNVRLHQLEPSYSFWQMPLTFLPESVFFEGRAHFRNDTLARIEIPTEKPVAIPAESKIKICRKADTLLVEDHLNRKHTLSGHIPLLTNGPFPLAITKQINPSKFDVKAVLQGIPVQGEVSLAQLKVSKATFLSSSNTPWVSFNTKTPLLPMNEEKETGVLLAKGFIDNGVLIGDRGYLSYSSATSSSLQEHRLPIFVAGFYDPGILSIGSKPILVPTYVTRAINASNSSFNLDKTQSNGVLVWFDALDQTEKVKEQLLRGLKNQGLDKYWKVTTFREYDFAKDLMQQFQSDKYLFSLVGIIILIVACCNIISMLVLLVNDKKREIGILQAMGASRFSIATIFGTCGIVMGILSSMIGVGAALLTLKKIDSIVQLLSYFQGHNAFNSTFFGSSLPGDLSQSAVLFILITTPLLSLLAGLIPAIIACRLRPSQILRAE